MMTDLNDAYKMMMLMTMVMMMIRMMKTENGHNSDKFEATPSRFYMVIAITRPILKL